jgi:phosphatidylinositol-3-phosphatase
MQVSNTRGPSAKFHLALAAILVAISAQLVGAASPERARNNDAIPDGLPRPDHVVVVIEENKSYRQIIGNMAAQYLNRLANEGALFTNSFAVTHPSQPNYLILFSGSTQGISDDRCPISVSGENLASQLRKKRSTFGIFSESMPYIGYGACSSPDNYYARKHNPAVNWQKTNISPDVNIPFADFPSDYSKLPTVSIVVPNLVNDMHDGRTLLDQIIRGDAWLRDNLDGYVQWAKTNNSLLVVTWDEDDGSGENRIPTMFIGPMVKPGKYATRIDHYSVLRTIEGMYGLPPLGRTVNADPISGVWISPIKGTQ